MSTTTAPTKTNRSAGRLLLFLGLAVAFLGVIGYAVQLGMLRLSAPWYLPAAATLAVILLIVALVRRVTVIRIVVLVFLGLFAAATWMFLLGTRLPAYTGPVAAGQLFPVFTTQQANGDGFTQADLAQTSPSVLVFFRGRW